jgi:hypothetical protein
MPNTRSHDTTRNIMGFIEFFQERGCWGATFMGGSLENRRKRLDNLLQNRGEDTKRNLKHVKDRAAPAGQFGDEDQVDFGPKTRALHFA